MKPAEVRRNLIRLTAIRIGMERLVTTYALSEAPIPREAVTLAFNVRQQAKALLLAAESAQTSQRIRQRR